MNRLEWEQATLELQMEHNITTFLITDVAQVTTICFILLLLSIELEKVEVRHFDKIIENWPIVVHFVTL